MTAADADCIDARATAAVAIARQAGLIARRYFRNRDALDTRQKGHRDLVTAADLAVDQLIRDRLAQLFPHDRILSEESAGGGEGNLWIIDPIDGTSNFARGIAHFAISIAFVRAEVVEIGVVYDIMADELFLGRNGQGSSCNGTRIETSRIDATMPSLIECGYSGRHSMAAYWDGVQALAANGHDFCQCGSAALGLAHVACGRLDGYWELHLFGWDVLAGLLLVREAGGWASDFDARASTAGAAVLASTSAISADLRRLTRFANGSANPSTD